MRVGLHTGLNLHAKAKFTRDMAETLLGTFSGLSDDAVVIVQVRDFGLWIENEGMGVPLFLGEAVHPNEKN